MARTRSPLLALPTELLQRILSCLSPESLASVSGTCRQLYNHTESDFLWRNIIRENSPGILLESPFPCRSFKELFVAHYPHWFLPRHKVWFSDDTASGKLIIARYDPRRGCIEAYRLVAEHARSEPEHWEHDQEVDVLPFDPHLQLHLDKPIIKLDPTAVHSKHSKRFLSEIPLPTVNGSVHSTFFLTQHLGSALWATAMDLWPPLVIPALQRVSNSYNVAWSLPKDLTQASDQAFRIRQWMEFASDARMGESIETYSTLMSELWTPTQQKPWRGIWVGDYLRHGCEFLLLRQPDTVSPASAVNEREGGSGHSSRGQTHDIYEGRLEAIKLTGDPYVPRGEYSWIAEDIGSGGLLRVAEEEEFRGARIVRSKAHIAGEGFIDGEPSPDQSSHASKPCN
ncbi:hypothetical protein FGG08_005126 [Glutinoglossum americanum]|uniref:F-box domain-containing protein n=1 Tax=Glutinoglossum americanum TaxID=1670608 RepID=A0A9P8IA13_9PEZI|nr:hypothetical protein FGG08_005126 [Glutinoglossum americanum]